VSVTEHNGAIWTHTSSAVKQYTNKIPIDKNKRKPTNKNSLKTNKQTNKNKHNHILNMPALISANDNYITIQHDKKNIFLNALH
jgi:hypothetical protein